MRSTMSTFTRFLQNQRFTWDLSQKRSFSSHLAIANPNVTARFHTSKTPLWNCKSQCNYDAKASLSRNPAPAQRNASPFLHDIPLFCKSQCNSDANWHVTHPWKVTFQSSPQRQCHRARIRTLADGCGRLRTCANGCELENNVGRTQLYPQTPKLNENPSLRIQEKSVAVWNLKWLSLAFVAQKKVSGARILLQCHGLLCSRSLCSCLLFLCQFFGFLQFLLCDIIYRQDYVGLQDLHLHKTGLINMLETTPARSEESWPGLFCCFSQPIRWIEFWTQTSSCRHLPPRCTVTVGTYHRDVLWPRCTVTSAVQELYRLDPVWHARS